jgi:fumarate reductase subunit D
MAKSNEPIVWSLFAGGGALCALLAPILILITGLIAPFGKVGFEQMSAVFSNPLVRLIVFLLVFLTFFHAAHRFRFTLVDVGLKPLKLPIAVLCYLAATVGTIWSVMVLFF